MYPNSAKSVAAIGEIRSEMNDVLLCLCMDSVKMIEDLTISYEDIIPLLNRLIASAKLKVEALKHMSNSKEVVLELLPFFEWTLFANLKRFVGDLKGEMEEAKKKTIRE